MAYKSEYGTSRRAKNSGGTTRRIYGTSYVVEIEAKQTTVTASKQLVRVGIKRKTVTKNKIKLN